MHRTQSNQLALHVGSLAPEADLISVCPAGVKALLDLQWVEKKQKDNLICQSWFEMNNKTCQDKLPDLLIKYLQPL